MAVKYPEVYRRFPLRVVAYRAVLLVGTLVLGGFVAARAAGWPGLAVYGAFALYAILRTMAVACRNCAYHGSRCDLGVSLLASLLHPQAGPRNRFVPGVREGLWLLGIMLLIPLLLGLAGVALDALHRPGPWNAPGGPALWALLLGYAAAVAAVIGTTVLSCPHCMMRGVCPLSFWKPQRAQG